MQGAETAVVKHLVYLLTACIDDADYTIDSSGHNKWSSIDVTRPAHSVKRLILLIYKAIEVTWAIHNVLYVNTGIIFAPQMVVETHIFVNVRLQYSYNTSFKTLVNSHLKEH